MTSSELKGCQSRSLINLKKKVKKEGKPPTKAPSRESMTVTTTVIKLCGKTVNVSDENKDTLHEEGQMRLTLKEMKSKQCSFLDSDVSGIFDDLLNANLIELLEMKGLEEVGKTDDPRYCKYHCLVGHPIHDCFIFKDKVIQLAHQGKILLEEDEATTYLIAIEVRSYYGNVVSCNATSEQKVSSDEACCSKVETRAMIEECMSAMTFIDDNLLLGSKPHNRPLFVAGYAHERRGSKAKEDPSNEQDDQVKGSKSKNEALVNLDKDYSNNKPSLGEYDLCKELILPLTMLDMKKSQLLKGFVYPIEEAKVEHREFLNLQCEGCFDLKANKFILKAEYNPKNGPLWSSFL
ncbi:hypothetical protein CDL12_02014 [Handroanthus impetiginosus]|uniref:Uncharacterized protein n=1 Tax=Handroanthus impetiginosus TaxID=429701 RepID=A0A2G9I679_9LAMI|nr:hypothetical protein CDL12_02014 [Handroanthus impetiginosus]